MLSAVERAKFEAIFARSRYRSRSAMMRVALMAWTTDTLSISGIVPEPEPTPAGSLRGRRGLHAYLSGEDVGRWVLAVDRSKMSGYRAATTAVLRWLARFR